MYPSRVETDKEELRKAAERGDVEFLRKCAAANKPHEYYLTVFSPRSMFKFCNGNMLHLAAWAVQEEFIREAIEGELVPLEVVHQLLCQAQSVKEKGNPLHVAALLGNMKIVKVFLSAFRIKQKEEDGESSTVCNPHHHLPPYNNHPRPWLLTNEDGRTPCHLALMEEKEECGLEILRMDKESLSNKLDDDGQSLLYLAVSKGQEKVAMEIVTSPHSFSASGPNGENALHRVPSCTSSETRKDICRLLLKKMPELIQKKTEAGLPILHIWASKVVLWLFDFLPEINSNDIIPDGRKVLVELISATDSSGANLIHYLVEHNVTTKEEAVKVGKLLIDIYRHALASSSTYIAELQFPWLAKDDKRNTPLDYAIDWGNGNFATMILSEDEYALEICRNDILFMAIRKRFMDFSLKILKIVDEKGLARLLPYDQRLNVLQLERCEKTNFFELLLELLVRVDEGGNMILDKWVKIGQVWPFEYLLKSAEIDPKSRRDFLSHLSHADDRNGYNTLFHVAATRNYEAILQALKIFIEAFKEEHPDWKCIPVDLLPWCQKNENDEAALHLAIRCQRDQRIALYLLSLPQEGSMAQLLDFYAPKEHEIIFDAVEKNFSEVVKMIMARLDKTSWTKYLSDPSTGRNVLHQALTHTDKELARWLITEAPELIMQLDNSGVAPFDEACDVGATRIIEAMLEKDPLTIFNKRPLPWLKACEKGYVSVIRAFIDHCPEKFTDYCIHHQDSPLHHIKLKNLMGYEEFLKIQSIMDTINVQDSNEATPLHIAIKDRNIMLAEALLNMDKIKCTIKDVNGIAARDLLAQLYKEQPEWENMCKKAGFNPYLKITYFERKTDLLEVRNTLSLVAALLATITFTAGFTLPGGLNQDTGEAMVVNKAAFAVFLISDTLAMCFSMVVLICLIWSMMFEPNESLYLIDRSVGLLRLALYLTLLAFVTGVYIVVSPKLLWAAILVIVLCCLVGVSANRQLMYGVFKCIDNSFDIVFSFVKKKCIDPVNSMELGLPLLCHCGESSNQNRTSTTEESART